MELIINAFVCTALFYGVITCGCRNPSIGIIIVFYTLEQCCCHGNILHQHGNHCYIYKALIQVCTPGSLVLIRCDQDGHNLLFSCHSVSQTQCNSDHYIGKLVSNILCIFHGSQFARTSQTGVPNTDNREMSVKWYVYCITSRVPAQMLELFL